MNLNTFFQEHNKIALGFSGGVDSSYLLYAAKQYGADVFPIFIKSQFQPMFELEDALRLAASLDINMNVIHYNVLANDQVTANLDNRCYFCKQNIFTALIEGAKEAGYTEIIDGTNASDDAGDRPGMRALREMNVLSPLQACGITKDQVRLRSKEAGLFTWDKPAYACLATRIPTDQLITEELLQKVESAESQLFDLGFKDFRVRVMGVAARLQFTADQMARAFDERKVIEEKLKPYFAIITIDLEEK